MSDTKKDSAKKDSASHAKKQRVRPTNKSLEAQRFSTVKVPRHNEVALHDSKSKIHEVDRPSSSNAAAFDPIPNDGMFNIVEPSSYWPPPSLDSFQNAASGDQPLLSADGLDMYDRRADDEAAKKRTLKVAKAVGEVSHPRGKTSVNAKVKFDDE